DSIHPAAGELGYARPDGVIEPGLIEIVAGALRVRAPDQVGKSGEQREVEVARALGLLAQGDPRGSIAGDHGKSPHGALIVADRGNDVVAAVARTILAQMPAFFFEPAPAPCDGPLLFGRLLPVGRIMD